MQSGVPEDRPSTPAPRLLAAFALIATIAACAASPNPSPRDSASSEAPSSPGAADLVTESAGELTLTHPASWRLVPGPHAVAGRTVPLAYLSNAELSVGACPTPAPDNSMPPCPQPIGRLPAGGVLVTIDVNMGLAEQVPPYVVTGAPDGRCTPVGADVEVWAATAGAVVTACLRGPGTDVSAAAARQLMATIGGRISFNRFDLWSKSP